MLLIIKVSLLLIVLNAQKNLSWNEDEQQMIETVLGQFDATQHSYSIFFHKLVLHNEIYNATDNLTKNKNPDSF